MTATKPSDRLTITVNDKPTEIFMSSGLRDRLVEVAGEATNLTEILTEPKMQEKLCVVALCPRDQRGKALSNFSIDDFEFSIEDGMTLKNWLAEHVFGFFTDTAQSVSNEHMSNLIVKLTLLLTGQQASVEENSSAGPLTVDTATST